MSRLIWISAGEPSGDHWAARLVEELKRAQGDLAFLGVGGAEMQSAGVELRHDMLAFSSLGLGDVLRNYGRYRAIFHEALDTICKVSPAAVILVDFPGFHIRLAKALKQRAPDIPVIYYVSPQIWAWGGRRKKTIARSVDHLIAILPFEPEIYRGTGLAVTWVGHPLADERRGGADRAALRGEFGVPAGDTAVALLPGSRPKEVLRIFPLMLEAAGRARARRPDLAFVAAAAPGLDLAPYRAILARYPKLPVTLLAGRSRDVLSCADFALVASGTSTLQAALAGTPFLILYKTGFLTALLAWLLIRIPYIGLVNVVAGRKVVPEFLQYAAWPPLVANSLLDHLSDGRKRAAMESAFAEVRAKLGPPGASRRAAEVILNLLSLPAREELTRIADLGQSNLDSRRHIPSKGTGFFSTEAF